ncbi:glycosyl hydrolase family 8 [Halobacillus halophilus]|uniref:glycosyl hydrolase family 8 n=1 Tax=Halobacillus halophilus TaxID=1570 RepID=UPI001CD509CA|nr:glycosyl hydrolase family 8 [Halobacillus halophilus]MCA1012287.1 glycosyl hydrolase [Halobacillus halophilus]
MKKTIMISLLIIVVINIAFFTKLWGAEAVSKHTESFIKTFMTNKNGTLATYIKNAEHLDSDEVRGREALSESLGLWMLYAVEKGDHSIFKEAYHVLETYFLTDDGFIFWKLTESGEAEVDTDALVDNLRITEALFKAEEQWNEKKYGETAIRIGEYMKDYFGTENIWTDFYDRRHRQTSNVLTYSYIDVEALKLLKDHQLIPPSTYKQMTSLLTEAELKNGFYPKSIHADSNKVSYNNEVNMIDQILVALNQAKWGSASSEFTNFVTEEMTTKGKLYGRYSLETKAPTVEYESPALYGFLILYAMELDDKKLALQAYHRMTDFRETMFKYKGGYAVSNGDTHIFDNLVPLLAEELLKKAGWLS